jgi:DNA-binding response OmpR family regulator
MKVMICEEDASKAKVLTDLLNVYKFKLITLTNSGEFYRQVQNHKPAIIILNENFSQKSREDVIDKLRMNPVSSKIPIIFITNEKDAEEQIHNSGEDSLVELMQEPFKIKHLRHCVDRWTTFRSLYVKPMN